MKQMIVMRKDLGMRKGKMIAQGAHASLGAVLPLIGQEPNPEDAAQRDRVAKLAEWLAGPFKKVCVSVDSEDQLVEVYEQAFRAGMIVSLITDAGLTEFDGVPTMTCCAIGPDTDEALAPITGELKLL